MGTGHGCNAIGDAAGSYPVFLVATLSDGRPHYGSDQVNVGAGRRRTAQDYYLVITLHGSSARISPSFTVRTPFTHKPSRPVGFSSGSSNVARSRNSSL